MGHTNGIHWAIEEISPEVAAEYLERNHARNRMRRDHRVRLWAEEMRQGRWQLTHQGIAFNREGDLVDGQHRLAAVIDAGVPVRMSGRGDAPSVSAAARHPAPVRDQHRTGPGDHRQ